MKFKGILFLFLAICLFSCKEEKRIKIIDNPEDMKSVVELEFSCDDTKYDDSDYFTEDFTLKIDITNYDDNPPNDVPILYSIDNADFVPYNEKEGIKINKTCSVVAKVDEKSDKYFVDSPIVTKCVKNEKN